MKNHRIQAGFTMIEMVMAMSTSLIVVLGLGAVLADNQRSWQKMYNGVNDNMIAESFVSRRTFDSLVRKASCGDLLIDSGGNWIEIEYYEDLNSDQPDRYGRLYCGDNTLYLETGTTENRRILGTIHVCGNVQSCTFGRIGRSAQMVLNLNDGQKGITVVCSAVMHN